MNVNCTHLTNDQDAALLCNWLISSGLRSAAQMDAGVPYVNFNATPVQIDTLSNTNGNGVLEASEIYSATIEVLEAEEERNFAIDNYSNDFLSFNNFVLDNTSFRIPWLFVENRTLSENIDDQLSTINEALNQKGLSENTRAYNLALAKMIADYIFAQDGLNISVAPLTHQNTPLASQEWTALEVAIQSHEADCSEFAMLFYELCRLAGLDARIALVTRNHNGTDIYHFCVALHLDPNNPDDVTLVDLTKNNPFSYPAPQEWVEIPKLSFIAYYHMNLGLTPPASVIAQGEQARYEFAQDQFNRGMVYDPYVALLQYNMGKIHYHYGHPELALPYLQEAHELDLDNTMIANQLSLVKAILAK